MSTTKKLTASIEGLDKTCPIDVTGSSQLISAARFECSMLILVDSYLTQFGTGMSSAEAASIAQSEKAAILDYCATDMSKPLVLEFAAVDTTNDMFALKVTVTQ